MQKTKGAAQDTPRDVLGAHELDIIQCASFMSSILECEIPVTFQVLP